MSFCGECGSKMKCAHCVGTPLGGVQACPHAQGAIWVQVVNDEGAPVKGATVSVGGARKTTDDSGLAHYDPHAEGPVKVEVHSPLPSPVVDTHALPKTVTADARVNTGEISFIKFKLEKINVVTPKIELEYKVVVLEHELAQHQASNKLYADVTRVELSFTETNPAHAFEAGGTFKCSPAKVEVFLDEGCTKPLAGDLTKDQLKAGSKFKLYLRGTSAGKFKASLELKDPSSPYIKRKDNPAEADMAVVALDLALYADKKAHSKVFFDTTAPTRTLMDAAGRVGKGRWLQVQDSGRHGRAKLVVKKPDDALWTVGQADYKLVLSKAAASGDVAVFRAETGGSAVTLPLDLPKSELGSDLTLWVEGAGASDALASVRLVLGLTRDDGGLAWAPKKNGDCAAFTVVEFEKVTPDADDYKQYVNLPADVAHPEYGREYKAKAKLTKALENVDILFSLIPDSANVADIPAATEHTKPADTLAAVKTKATGEAEAAGLKLSSYGGAKFKVAAYLPDAPPPGKDVPAKNQSKDLEIWRQLYYTVVCMKRADGTSYADRLDEAGFTSTFETSFVKFTRVGAVQTKPFKSVVKDSQIGTWNGANFGGDVVRTLNIGLIEAQTGDTVTQIERDWHADADYDATNDIATETLSGFTIDLSSQGEWLVDAHYQDDDDGSGTAPWNAVAGNRVTLALDGLDHKLRVDCSGFGVAPDKLRLFVRLKTLPEWSGDKTGHSILIGMRWRERSYPGQETDSARQTTLHETGHFLGLAPTLIANAAEGANDRYYVSNGGHCNYNTNQCTMYHAFGFVFDFCDRCSGSIKARDLATPPAGNAGY